MKIGDTVRVMKIPADLPPDNAQLQTLFKGCLNKSFKVAGIDDEGLVELHVGEAFGSAPEHHKVWLEPNHVKLIEA
jgi:hypothetical protein